MGFTEKTSQYQVCVKFIKTISPKNIRNQTDVVVLKSPTEDQTINNISDILIVKDTDTQKEDETEKKDEKVQEHEEHKNLGRMPTEMEHNQSCEEKSEVPRGLRNSKPKTAHGDYKNQTLKTVA